MSSLRKLNMPTTAGTNEGWESGYVHLLHVLYHLSSSTSLK